MYACLYFYAKNFVLHLKLRIVFFFCICFSMVMNLVIIWNAYRAISVICLYTEAAGSRVIRR